MVRGKARTEAFVRVWITHLPRKEGGEGGEEREGEKRNDRAGRKKRARRDSPPDRY